MPSSKDHSHHYGKESFHWTTVYYINFWQAQQAEPGRGRSLDIQDCREMCQTRHFAGRDMSKVYVTDSLSADDSSGIYCPQQGYNFSRDHKNWLKILFWSNLEDRDREFEVFLTFSQMVLQILSDKRICIFDSHLMEV